MDIAGISLGYCCIKALNVGWKNKGEGVAKGKVLIKLVVVKGLKWDELKVDDNHKVGLGKDGVDLGIKNEGDKILRGERYRKEREQLTLLPRWCVKIVCVEIFNEEITDWMRRTSGSRGHGSLEGWWLKRNIYFKWKEEMSNGRSGRMDLIHIAWFFHKVEW